MDKIFTIEDLMEAYIQNRNDHIKELENRVKELEKELENENIGEYNKGYTNGHKAGYDLGIEHAKEGMHNDYLRGKHDGFVLAKEHFNIDEVIKENKKLIETVEEIKKTEFKNGWDCGYEKGKKSGMSIGWAKGYNSGIIRGKTEGDLEKARLMFYNALYGAEMSDPVIDLSVKL